MANVFDATTAYESVPSEFVVGDFVQWKRSDLAVDYPIATHSMEIVARVRGGGADEIKIAATEVSSPSDAYLFTANSATTAAYVAGRYYWHLEVTKTASGDRAVIEIGEWNILADLDVTGADTRSHAEIMVTKIESLLEGKADADVANYAIGGRSLTKLSFEELMSARNVYRAEVRRERAKMAQATIKVQF